ncbi:MAG: DUF697 domain-containing protein [Kiritimatiellae bacterium]|nr:DUF697 domain-containing protein [Kiritimatiellia bacterium]
MKPRGDLVPIPVFDLVAVAGLQLNMLRRICKIYEVKFSKNIGKKSDRFT